MVPIILSISVLLSIAANDLAFILVGLTVAVIWHEFLMLDIHNHLVELEQDNG